MENASSTSETSPIEIEKTNRDKNTENLSSTNSNQRANSSKHSPHSKPEHKDDPSPIFKLIFTIAKTYCFPHDQLEQPYNTDVVTGNLAMKTTYSPGFYFDASCPTYSQHLDDEQHKMAYYENVRYAKVVIKSASSLSREKNHNIRLVDDNEI